MKISPGHPLKEAEDPSIQKYNSLLKIDDHVKMDYKYLMAKALEEAKKGLEEGEVPIGAVLADKDGSILAKDHNRTIALKDPTAHAEILVLRQGGEIKKNYRLKGAILAVTIEPCPMCAGAAVNARIEKLVFGAYDPKSGAAGSVYNIVCSEKLNHRIEIISGILEDKCSTLLKSFFKAKRKGEVPKWS